METENVAVSNRRMSCRWRPFIVISTLVAVLAIAWAGARHPLFNPLLNASTPSAPPCSCKQLQNLTGVVEDCCCDYQTVTKLNHNVIRPILRELVTKPFFRYFKVRLWCDCLFWPDDGMCRLRDCSVCECPDNEFPEAFKGNKGHLSAEDTVCQEGKPQGTVDRTLDNVAFKRWMEVDNPWTYDDETDNGEMTYVNLLRNPERYTGYTGPSPRRIWNAIYEENCFYDESEDTCTERRVFFRLISGLHTSISTHIAADYLLDEATNKWGPNPVLFYERVLQYPWRIKNLYFTYLFVLRAIMKAGDFLSQAEYSTGDPVEDATTHQMVVDFLQSEELRSACPLPFNEAQMWKGADGAELKGQIQQHFRNISALMDCVGCEKCRLWGKLQVLGMGTALKILFAADNEAHAASTELHLQRNEVIALFNLLSRLSESIEYVQEMAPTAERLIEGALNVEVIQNESSWSRSKKPSGGGVGAFQKFSMQ